MAAATSWSSFAVLVRSKCFNLANALLVLQRVAPCADVAYEAPFGIPAQSVGIKKKGTRQSQLMKKEECDVHESATRNVEESGTHGKRLDKAKYVS